MEIRLAEKRDIPGMIGLLKQVGSVHHDIRPDLFRDGAQKYGESQLEALLKDEKRPIFVGIEDGRMLGYCFCIVEEVKNDPVLRDVKSLCVDFMKGEEVNQHGAEELPFDMVVFGLNMPREILYERINRRVDIMLEQGLEAEVRRLLDEGVPTDCQSMKSIGYRQMLWYIVDGMDYDFAVDKLKQATHNFAKRQVTFFKGMPYIEWFELDATPGW